ncbi:MAG: ABC transporter permease [Planctomycetes bacterium]|nr:ABC transporter permease [Planctomycetota bacterium]MCD7897750.1 ABC transporter permease [Planctomycetaceae bacterium]
MFKNLYYSVRDQAALLVIIALFFLAMSVASPYFLRISNLVNIVQYVSVYGITAIGMTMVILTGGINLSVGGTLALSTWVCSFSILRGVPWPIAILFALIVGGLVGTANGIAVARVGIPPLIGTLALEQITRGLQLVFSKGRPLHGFPESFLSFGAGRVAGIPMPVIWTLLLFLLFAFILSRTCFGRNIYAVGGNPVATKIAGIKNSRVIILVYVLAGMLSSFAGIILIARMDSSPSAIALGLDMQAITACVIGGASVTCGGKGTIFGTFLGIVMMGLIQNSLDLLNVSAYYQQFVQGLVILAAVTVDALRNSPNFSLKRLFTSRKGTVVARN